MAIFQTKDILFVPESYKDYSQEVRDDIYRVSQNVHNSKLYTLINTISLFLLGVHSVSSNLLPEISLYTELAMIAGVNMFLCIMFYSERGYTISVLTKLVLRNYSKQSLHSIIISISVILVCYSTLLFAISFNLQYLSSMFIYISCLIGFLLHLSLREIHTATTESLSKLLVGQEISKLETQYILTENGVIHTVDKYSFEESGLLKQLHIHSSQLEDIN